MEGAAERTSRWTLFMGHEKSGRVVQVTHFPAHPGAQLGHNDPAAYSSDRLIDLVNLAPRNAVLGKVSLLHVTAYFPTGVPRYRSCRFPFPLSNHLLIQKVSLIQRAQPRLVSFG